MTQILTGQIAFWLRIALIAASGWFASNAGVQIYDPATGVISIHVDEIANLAVAVGSFLGWKGWHSIALSQGGKL